AFSQFGKVEVPWAAVSPGFFQMMGIPVREGRDFTESDQTKTRQVMVVNESMAKHFWPGQSPLGKRIKHPFVGDEWITVIGVVADHRRNSLESEIGPEFYRPTAQSYFRWWQMFLRTDVDPLSLADPVRQSVRNIDRGLPVQKLQTMKQLLADKLALRYYSTLLLSIFALVALLLAAVGIYGVLSYQVRQRTREIGIRQALGAQPRDILLLLTKRGMILALIGLLFGLTGSLALGHLTSTLLYGVSAFDVNNLITVSVVLLGIIMLASILPGLRAIRVEPMSALRHE